MVAKAKMKSLLGLGVSTLFKLSLLLFRRIPLLFLLLSHLLHFNFIPTSGAITRFTFIQLSPASFPLYIQSSLLLLLFLFHVCHPCPGHGDHNTTTATEHHSQHNQTSHKAFVGVKGTTTRNNTRRNRYHFIAKQYTTIPTLAIISLRFLLIIDTLC